MDMQKCREFSEKCRARNSIVNQYNEYSMQLNEIYLFYNSKEYQSNKKFPFFVRVILFAIGFIVSIVALFIINDLGLRTPSIKNNPMIGTLIIVTFGVALLSIIFFFSYLKKNLRLMKNDKNATRNRPILEKACADSATEIENADRVLISYDLLPDKYFYAGECIIGYILDRRADSIKEAINLFEAESRQNVQFKAQMDQLLAINQQIIATNHQLKSNQISNAIGQVAIAGVIGFKNL